MKKVFNVIQVGLGPVGQMLTPFLLERSNLKIVGAVDVNPTILGKDLGDVSSVGRKLGIPIVESLNHFAKGVADVAVVTTASKLSALQPTLEAAAKMGLRVVSTCEEMVYPWTRQPELSKQIHTMAQKMGVAFLSTGVNPGFLMDFLPLAATAISRDVKSFTIERFQDASKRRIPFQQKIGTGLTIQEFQSRVKDQKMGHVGLTESMQMIAARLGWNLERTEDVIEPVIAHNKTASGLGEVPSGNVIGLSQHGRAWVNGNQVLTLDFRAAIGETETRDTIHVNGTPSFTMNIPGGIHGDVATCAIVTNAIPAIMGATPGLKTMIDVPLVGFQA